MGTLKGTANSAAVAGLNFVTFGQNEDRRRVRQTDKAAPAGLSVSDLLIVQLQ